MHLVDKPGSSTMTDRDLAVPNALAEFAPERPARVRPATVTPAPHPRETPRAHIPVAVPAAGQSTPKGRRGIWTFTCGSAFGALVCVLAIYWVTTLQSTLPEPVPPAAPAMSPAVEPPRVVPDEPREPPAVVDKTSLMPAPTPNRRAERPTAVVSPRVAATIGPYVGSLKIDSTPQGANVFIDRRPAGVTPLVVTDLVAGSHVIRLEAEGHTPWSSAIRVVANRQTDVSAHLAPSLGRTSLQR